MPGLLKLVGAEGSSRGSTVFNCTVKGGEEMVLVLLEVLVWYATS